MFWMVLYWPGYLRFWIWFSLLLNLQKIEKIKICDKNIFWKIPFVPETWNEFYKTIKKIVLVYVSEHCAYFMTIKNGSTFWWPAPMVQLFIVDKCLIGETWGSAIWVTHLSIGCGMHCVEANEVPISSRIWVSLDEFITTLKLLKKSENIWIHFYDNLGLAE